METSANSSPENPPAATSGGSASPVVTDDKSVLCGIAASAGIAVGPALVHRASSAVSGPQRHARDPVQDLARERDAARAALVAAAADLRGVAEQVRRDIGATEAEIFATQALMLEDPTILERAHALIDQEAVDAASALYEAAEEQATALAELPDPLWQARATDVRDAAQRAISHLADAPTEPDLSQRIAGITNPVIVIARDLTPSDTAQMRPDRVLGIALAEGSATAHAAILARALGIPAIVGLGQGLLDAQGDGDMLILDGSAGTLIRQPSAEQIAQAHTRASRERAAVAARQTQRDELRAQPGKTRDGHAVALLANVGSTAEARAAAAAGAEGIGLLRTEFLFSERADLPDENAQAELYSSIVEAFGDPRRPIIIRTLDAGADKPLQALAPYLRDLPLEANPALGVRGIRLHMRLPELLTAQFRGILTAAAQTGADLRVMLPMIATLGELRDARRLLTTARDDLAACGIHLNQTVPLGIMVETPAAVFACDILAREATFFSIGTNDLTQYVMAADRLSAPLASLNNPLQPAVLRAIDRIVHVAHLAQRHVGVCGEMAGIPAPALLLAGLGVTELSMTPSSLPAVKEALASRTIGELRARAQRALAATTADDVAEIVCA